MNDQDSKFIKNLLMPSFMLGIIGDAEVWWASQAAIVVKNLPVQETQETQVQSLGQEDALGMATCPSSLAWRIPRTEKPGGLQSMGSQRVGDD